MPKYTRWMPTIVMSIVAMLPLTVARGDIYTAIPYASNSSGSVSDHMVDPLVGPTTHDYSKTTGDVTWKFDYINNVNPKENITINGWARFSLDGLPDDAIIESASVSLWAYALDGGGAPMVVTALAIDPMAADAETLYGATASGMVLSGSGGNFGPMSIPLNGVGLDHLQDAISQGWVAVGYKYDGPQLTLDKGYRCYGADQLSSVRWPKIEITYVPEPTALMLLGLGGAAVLGRRRKRVRK